MSGTSGRLLHLSMLPFLHVGQTITKTEKAKSARYSIGWLIVVTAIQRTLPLCDVGLTGEQGRVNQALIISLNKLH